MAVGPFAADGGGGRGGAATGGEMLDGSFGTVGAGATDADAAGDPDDPGEAAESVSALEILTSGVLDSGVGLLADDAAVPVCLVDEWPQLIKTTQVAAAAADRRWLTQTSSRFSDATRLRSASPERWRAAC
jgi:hypothetical protein